MIAEGSLSYLGRLQVRQCTSCVNVVSTSSTAVSASQAQTVGTASAGESTRSTPIEGRKHTLEAGVGSTRSTAPAAPRSTAPLRATRVSRLPDSVGGWQRQATHTRTPPLPEGLLARHEGSPRGRGAEERGEGLSGREVSPLVSPPRARGPGSLRPLRSLWAGHRGRGMALSGEGHLMPAEEEQGDCEGHQAAPGAKSKYAGLRKAGDVSRDPGAWAYSRARVCAP